MIATGVELDQRSGGDPGKLRGLIEVGPIEPAVADGDDSVAPARRRAGVAGGGHLDRVADRAAGFPLPPIGAVEGDEQRAIARYDIAETAREHVGDEDPGDGVDCRLVGRPHQQSAIPEALDDWRTGRHAHARSVQARVVRLRHTRNDRGTPATLSATGARR